MTRFRTGLVHSKYAVASRPRAQSNREALEAARLVQEHLSKAMQYAVQASGKLQFAAGDQPEVAPDLDRWSWVVRTIAWVERIVAFLLEGTEKR